MFSILIDDGNSESLVENIQLNNQEFKDLQKILCKNFSELNKYVKTDNLDENTKISNENILKQLKSMNFVILKQNNTFILVNPNKLVKNLDEKDTIKNFLYKIPSKYQNYWEFFSYMGSEEKLSLIHI